MSQQQVTETDDVDGDILIIGGGPVGLYAAYCAGFRGLSVVVIDALSQLGGQISAMYPEKEIRDIAGLPCVTGRSLVEQLVRQAAVFEPTYVLGENAEKLEHDDAGRVLIETSSGRRIRVGAVVITGGIGKFTPRPMTHAEQFVGRGLSYFVPTLKEHAGKDVVVVGGGDSAFDWAAHLEPIARSVTLVHRRDRFRAHAATVAQVMGTRVRMMLNAEVTAAHGADWLESIEVSQKSTGISTSLPAQSLVAALGFTADLSTFESWGIEMNSRTIEVDTRMRTNLPLVFAAGDITNYLGKVRLISVGFGEAATAVNNAAHALDPSLSLFPGHSTEQEE